MGTQQLVHETDAVKPDLPIDIGNEAYAGNDIAYCNVGSGLAMVLIIDHRLERIAKRIGLEFQRIERLRCQIILIAQPLDQLNRERLGNHRLFKLVQQARSIRVLASKTENLIGKIIGSLPAAPRGYDAL